MIDNLEKIITKTTLNECEIVDIYESEFYPLSNFSSFRLLYKGINFDTSEHAYHYQKFNPDGGVCKDILESRSAHDAFKLAEACKSLRRKDWDDIKINVMIDILWTKVNQHEYVKRKLLETGNRQIQEKSWRDGYWGMGPNNDGQNMLGKLWMEIRKEIKNEQH